MGSKSSVVSISCTPFDYLLYLLLWSDILTAILLQPLRTETHQLSHLFAVSPSHAHLSLPVCIEVNLPNHFPAGTFSPASLVSLACLTTPIQVSDWHVYLICTHDSQSHVDLYKWRAITPLLSSIQSPTHWGNSHTHLFPIFTFCWRTCFLFHWD